MVKCISHHIFKLRGDILNSVNPDPHSNTTILKTSSQITGIETDIYILGLAVSNFSHQHNELLRQQKETTIKTFQECSEKLKKTAENRKKVNADFKARLTIINKTYKDARKRIKEEFKEFRKIIESLIKGAEELELIDKKDVKDFKKELGTFEKETKSVEKNFQNETKNAEKNFEKETKLGAYRNLFSAFQT